MSCAMSGHIGDIYILYVIKLNFKTVGLSCRAHGVKREQWRARDGGLFLPMANGRRPRGHAVNRPAFGGPARKILEESHTQREASLGHKRGQEATVVENGGYDEWGVPRPLFA
jgi:hypothetical protein